MLVGYSVSRVQDKANPKPVRPKAVWREGEGGKSMLKIMYCNCLKSLEGGGLMEMTYS